MTQSIGIALRFFGLVLLANLVALMLVLFLGLGVIVFFVVNGYLLGREYFQFAALRHVTVTEASVLWEHNKLTVFLAGLAITVLVSIPFVNLLTPLFAGALMMHVFKYVASRSS